MILVVCLNPALDITHHVAAVDWAGVNRPRAVDTRPGGKGLNVARTLSALSAEPLVVGLAGGPTGDAVTGGLTDLGVPSDLTRIAGETRRTFAVLDEARGTCAMFNEAGPSIGIAEWQEFLLSFERSVAKCQAVVLSGSLPPGLAADTYATLIRMAGGAGVPVVLDAHGEALRLGAAAGPAIIKPNLDELADLAGQPLSLTGDGPGRAVASAAAELRAAGAGSVVVSLGPAGLHAVTPSGSWRAVPPAVDAVNPTGAGDAVVAGLTRGLVQGQPWPDRLRDAAALGTAVALAPVAGEFSPAGYARVRAGVTVSEVQPARYGSAGRGGHDGHARQGNGGGG